MNNHLTDEHLVALYYGDSADREHAKTHLDACDACRASFAQLQELLGSVKHAGSAEPLHGFEERTWRKVHAGILEGQRPRWGFTQAKQWAYALGITAAIALAFVIGRFSPRGPVPQIAQGPSGEVRERILLINVADHLDRSRVLLLELVNAAEADSVPLDRDRAAGLVSDNRLYRQAASRDGDHATVAVLEDLERVLMEIENAPDSVGRDDLQTLRAAIEDRGLLLKVRVVGSQARERVSNPRRDSVESVI